MTSSKKVGILTFHFTTNYGAVLQAYALANLVRDLGFSCEVVDYRPWSAIKVYFKQLFRCKNPFLGAVKVMRFYLFIKSHLHLSHRSFYGSDRGLMLLSSYDAVIVGSDEVWKTDSFRGFDPIFFMSRLIGEGKRIAFSASTGSSMSFGKQRREVCDALRRFEFISVRDDKTKSVLAAECGLDAVRSFDPTLLYDDWGDFCSRHGGLVPDVRYVLVYGSLSAEEIEYVIANAESEGQIVISVGEINHGVWANRIAVGPKEWLALIFHAEIIYTTFFHGAIFALKFHGRVRVLRRAQKNYKIDQLAKDLDLDVGVSSIWGVAAPKCKVFHYKYSTKTKTLLERNRKIAIDRLYWAVNSIGPCD